MEYGLRKVAANFSTMTLLRLLLCGIFLPLMNCCGTVCSAAANAAPTLKIEVPISGRCCTFMYLEKSGGTTVKKILTDGLPRKSKLHDLIYYTTGVTCLPITGLYSDARR